MQTWRPVGAKGCLTNASDVMPEASITSRFQLLTDAQWLLIEDLLPARTGKKGRPFRDARQIVEGIIYRYRCGIAWRDVPEAFGPWQTVWTWHRRMSEDGTWDAVLVLLLTDAPGAGLVDRAVSIDSTIARAHQHAANVTRHDGGWVELQQFARRAA
ncbi:transposase [Mycobacterium sp. MAA66]|uniref:transposase n=1 Tax=Mycobacterium sp. MAA66 TaxID=3156297 RepID=UPI00351153B2